MGNHQAQRDGAEGDKPGVSGRTVGYCDAHQFSYEGRAHEDQFAMPFDLSIGSHPPHLCQRGILDITNSLRIGSERGHIQGCRGDLTQGLVRAHTPVGRTML